MGKELMVFAERLHNQLLRLPNSVHVKFGGCIGNLNAHHITFPSIGRKWLDFADDFVLSMNDCYKIVQFKRAQFTTQIDHYDDMAAVFDANRRLNIICIDLCRDMWSYISRNIFKLAIVEGEVGSSTMPHKVNPIDFENAEGNLGLGNSMFDFLSNKLPVSRLQRDLTDSTVVRNIGVAFGYSLVAYKSILKGLDKIDINYESIQKELKNNTVVIAEAIQQILRSAGVDEAYDLVKELTRKHPPPTMFDIQEFIMDLDVDKVVVDRLLEVKPETYTGIYPKDYKEEIYDVPIARSTETLSFEVSKHLLEKVLQKNNI